MNINTKITAVSLANTRRKQQGLAALEFIITLPVLLMLAVLVIDVGQALIQYTQVNKALQNGARYAVVDTYGTLDFGSIADEEKIKNIVVYGKPTISDTAEPILDFLNLENVSLVSPTPATKEVTLNASFTYTPFFSELPFTDTSLAFSFDAAAKMRTSP
ncbi:pilus assembly protein [Vibrio sp. 404]|uniref:Pilus assembly protein n=1 Tax=Vibrio marinisediminis TaxID=2758441 RepID=A0A7W2ITG1_9VIBR|nr:TadE family protein [Vibrio marinisediminis]MBA5762309.1 pilus assembly protein [Vibrio marinisediminis]